MISYSQQSAADSKSSFCCWVRLLAAYVCVVCAGDSHGGVAVEADVQVVLQGIDRVPGQPLEQHVVETLHQSALHTPRRVKTLSFNRKMEKHLQLCTWSEDLSLNTPI